MGGMLAQCDARCLNGGRVISFSSLKWDVLKSQIVASIVEKIIVYKDKKLRICRPIPKSYLAH